MKYATFSLSALLSSLLLIFVWFSTTSSGCKTSNDPLSPARNIAGTWTTPAAVTFYMTSDGCGTYSRYNKTPITLTFTITETDDNHVDVDISANSIGTTTQIGSNCGSPSTLNFPLYFHGTVSSSNLQLTESIMQYDNQGHALGLQDVVVGSFNITSNNMTGTIVEKDCPIYCMGYETDNQTCIVTR